MGLWQPLRFRPSGATGCPAMTASKIEPAKDPKTIDLTFKAENKEALSPVTITEEASAWIDKVGMRREFEQMLAHTKETVPGLKFIEVTLVHDPCPSIDPGVVLWAVREDPGTEEDRTNWDWGAWKVSTFP